MHASKVRFLRTTAAYITHSAQLPCFSQRHIINSMSTVHSQFTFILLSCHHIMVPVKVIMKQKTFSVSQYRVTAVKLQKHSGSWEKEKSPVQSQVSHSKCFHIFFEFSQTQCKESFYYSIATWRKWFLFLFEKEKTGRKRK